MRRGVIVLGCVLMIGAVADGSSGAAEPGVSLVIKDAAFTDDDRTPPVKRVEVFGPTGDTLRFWFELTCSQACQSELAPGGELVLEVLGLFDPGNGSGIDHGDQVKFVTDRPQLLVSKPASALRPGRWAAAVAFGTDFVCLPDQRTCKFPVRVTPR